MKYTDTQKLAFQFFLRLIIMIIIILYKPIKSNKNRL